MQKVLLGILVILIGAAGFMLWQNKSSKFESDQAKNRVESKVLDFYRTYSDSIFKSNKGTRESLSEAYKQGFLSQDAYNGLLSANLHMDPVLCTQGGSDQPILIDSSSLGNQNATAVVKQYYTGSKNWNRITVMVRLSDLKITSINCNR